MCMSLFKKKTPKNWEFGDKPVVHWNAANTMGKYDPTTVCKIILTQILDIKDITLDVYTNDKLVSKFDTEDIKMSALLDGHPECKHYSLHLRNDVPYFDLLSIICHEMIHLEQYNDNQLKLEGTTFIWKGIKYEGVPYWDRPWEIEARKRQYDIEKQVKKLYYE